jgi:ABC-type lipoprotein release transport system permease subunit
VLEHDSGHKFEVVADHAQFGRDEIVHFVGGEPRRASLDPITYLDVTALLAGASAIACCLPAWRAARVDPSITLRAE